MNQEFRRAPRRTVDAPVQVVDCMTGEVMGRLGNVSETGMLLFSRGAGVEEGLFQVRFGLRLSGAQEHLFHVGVQQLWSEAHPASGNHWTGYRFIDIAPEDLELLRDYVTSGSAQRR